MRTRNIIREARRLGREAGENAASWCIDGNTTDETKARIIRGYDDGDPEIMDMFRLPDLSGEYADGPTPRSLAEDIGIEEDDERMDGACTAWEEAVSKSFWRELIHACRA